jgi:hypothetical protein
LPTSEVAPHVTTVDSARVIEHVERPLTPLTAGLRGERETLANRKNRRPLRQALRELHNLKALIYGYGLFSVPFIHSAVAPVAVSYCLPFTAKGPGFIAGPLRG